MGYNSYRSGVPNFAATMGAWGRSVRGPGRNVRALHLVLVALMLAMPRYTSALLESRQVAHTGFTG